MLLKFRKIAAQAPKDFIKSSFFKYFFLLERSSGRVERSSDNPAKNFLFKERSERFLNYSENCYFRNVRPDRYKACRAPKCLRFKHAPRTNFLLSATKIQIRSENFVREKLENRAIFFVN